MQPRSATHEVHEPPNEATYPRDARMTTPAEFDRCLRRSAFHRSGSFALHLCWIDAAMHAPTVALPATPMWRLGLVIPKRYEASAVARNTIKRRWRDAFRRGRVAWAAEFGSVDVVVRLQGPLVPKPPKIATKGKVATRTAVAPARVRARDRFDPAPLLATLVERLRSRGGRPPVVAAP
ncbi:MAG: ribonuclease P protein component [Burkholderiaceae bacterium]